MEKKTNQLSLDSSGEAAKEPAVGLFGEFLHAMIKESEFTYSAFYKELGIKKAYFYDIISGRTNPPPPEKQFKIIALLKPDKETTELFFDLAAKERHEFPADLELLIDDEMKKKLRSSREYTRLLKLQEGEK